MELIHRVGKKSWHQLWQLKEIPSPTRLVFIMIIMGQKGKIEVSHKTSHIFFILNDGILLNFEKKNPWTSPFWLYQELTLEVEFIETCAIRLGRCLRQPLQSKHQVSMKPPWFSVFKHPKRRKHRFLVEVSLIPRFKKKNEVSF